MPDYPIPFTDEHLAACDRVLQRCRMGLALAEDCKACGFDTSEYISSLVTQQDMATKFKQRFFPDRV